MYLLIMNIKKPIILFQNIFRLSLLSWGMIISAPAFADPDNPDYYSEIVRLDSSDPEAHLAEMLESGGIMLNRRADLVLMLLPYDDEPWQLMSEAPRKNKPRRRYPTKPIVSPRPEMDVALQIAGTDRILSGAGLQQPFDGTGVVVGFCDTGFDTRHINFTDSDGECRIRRVVRYTESEGICDVYSTPAEIYDFHTDTPHEKHATHVAGIMAGSHALADMAGVTAGSRIIGMAPGADIVATVSELTEVGLLAGVEEIIAYAKEVGKPAVINMSVGSYTGPHDGSSLFCQYLDMCAEDAIICLSSGNEGAHTVHQYLDDASFSRPMRIRIAGNDWVNLKLYGETDIYAADDTPFSLALRISDSTADNGISLIYESEEIDFSKTPFIVLSTSERPEMEEWTYDRNLAKHFAGDVYLSGGIDPENGRYYASILYNCTTEELYSDDKPWARYRLEFVARPESQVRLDAFADASRSWLANWNGNPAPPGNSLSISNLACGHKTVSVGMYCLGRNVTTFSGHVNSSEFETPLKITNHSSYGVLADGRRMPLTVGPGMPIVSSFSGAYVKEHGYGECSVAFTADDGETYYWGPMTGTSMSSPFVAGTIATWLQANPDLKWNDIHRILSETNYLPYFAAGTDDSRYGEGIFDGYSGLLKAIAATSVRTPGATDTLLKAMIHNGYLDILNSSGNPVTVSVYTVTGICTGEYTYKSESSHHIPLHEIITTSSTPVILRIYTPGSDPVSLKGII